MTDSLDRKDLKIQALLEKVSQLTTTYEDRIADLRVELTVSGAEAQEVVNTLQAQIAELNNGPLVTTGPEVQVVEGEVVQEEG